MRRESCKSTGHLGTVSGVTELPGEKHGSDGGEESACS